MTQTAHGAAPSRSSVASAGAPASPGNDAESRDQESRDPESRDQGALGDAPLPSKPTLGEPTLMVETVAAPDGGRFARVEVDVPVMLGSRGGPVVGYLRRGTRVRLGSAVDGEIANVITPFPGVHPHGGFLKSADESLQSPISFSIETRTSEKTRKTLERYRSFGSPSKARFGLYRELSATAGGSGFAFLRCGRFRELEKRAARTRILAEFDAGELEGWIDTPTLAERDRRCDFGTSEVLPHGYSPVDSEAPSKILALAAARTELYLPPKRGEMSRCERWSFVPSKDGATGSLLVSDAGAVDGSETQTMRSYGIVGPVINLGGLVYKQKDKSVVAGGKVDFFAVVRVTDKAVDVLEWEPHRDALQSPLVGYQAATARTWYLSRQACETAGAKRAKADPIAPKPATSQSSAAP